MKKKHSVGIILLLEFVVFALVICINLGACNTVGFDIFPALQYLIDTPSLLLIILMVIPALAVSGMGRDFLRIFTVGRKNYTLRELKRTLEATLLTQKIIICAACISMMISFIVFLHNLENLSAIGPNLAVAALAIFYAACLEFFLAPLKANVQNAIFDLMDVEDEEA